MILIIDNSNELNRSSWKYTVQYGWYPQTGVWIFLKQRVYTFFAKSYTNGSFIVYGSKKLHFHNALVWNMFSAFWYPQTTRAHFLKIWCMLHTKQKTTFLTY